MSVPELSLVEQQVVALIAEGRSRAEIAARVGIDEQTVEWHLTRAARKLAGVSALHRRVTESLGSPNDWRKRC